MAKNGDFGKFIVCHFGQKGGIIIEALSKKGFWFNIEAEPNFPALRDSPSDLILAEGHNPKVPQTDLRKLLICLTEHAKKEEVSL